MSEKLFSPFPNIPQGGFEGEGLPQKPTIQTSLLISDSEKSVLQNPVLLSAIESGKIIVPHDTESTPLVISAAALVSDLIFAGNAQDRRKKRDALSSYIRSNFPTNYNVMSMLLSWQSNVELSEQIGVLPATPRNASVALLLREHQIITMNESARHEEELSKSLGEVFKKDRLNYYVFEAATGGDELFYEGFEKFGSFMYARGYSNIKRANPNTNRVTRETIKDKLRYLLLESLQSHTDRFRYSTYVVLDNMLNVGYKIVPVREDPMPNSVEWQQKLQDTETKRNLEEKRHFLEDHNKFMIERNQRIARQATFLMTSGNPLGENTSVAIQVGMLHGKGAGIDSFFPELLQPIVSRFELSSHNKRDLDNSSMIKLLRGEGITDAEVEEIYTSLVGSID